MAAHGPRKSGRAKLQNAFRSSSNKANAVGYAKRKSRSVKAISGISDVYNFEAPKTKRANVKLALDREEEQGAGYDDDDDEDEMQDRRRPRLIGEGKEDEQIDSDEDDEIDSDAAFEEEDEIRFAEFDFKRGKQGSARSSKSKKASQKEPGKGVRFAEVDLNEDEGGEEPGMDSASTTSEGSSGEEEEEEEGEDDEFIDVLDVLDGRGEPDLDDDNASEANVQLEKERRARPLPKGRIDQDEEMSDEEREDDEGDGDDDEDVESNEEIAISGDESDEADPSALEKLDKLVSELETGSKRKASDEDDAGTSTEPSQAKKKKRLAKDVTEAGIESEFGAKASGSSKLSLDDLLVPLVSKQDSLSNLKKTLKPLASSSNPKNQPLPAPLPTRTQDKLDRAAAYEQTKEEVDKWNETMKRIREAEHLSFPLQAPKSIKTSNLELTAKFKPTTELESSIDKLLKSAKLREEDIAKTEELMMKDLTVEEVAERRAELRKMRELTFRAEMKAKRVSKIKSKAYRRIQKKAKEKLMAKLDAGVDGELDEEEARMKAEIERARERATLKHKNTGKWAKVMKARNELDEDQRRDIAEMLERGERLRRRIHGQDSGSEDEDEAASSDDEFDGEERVARIKASAFEELEKLRGDDGELDVDDDPSDKRKAKSVFQMKFMKDAAARQNREVNKMIDDFTKEMGAMPENSDDEGVETRQDDATAPVERVNGRMVFRPGPQLLQTQRSERVMHPPLPPPSAISETSTMKSHDSFTTSPVNEITVHDSPALSLPPSRAKVTTQENPWLSLPEASSSRIVKRSNEIVLSIDSTLAQKSEMTLKKQISKTAGARQKDVDDARLEISAEDVMVVKQTVPVVETEKKRKGKKKKKKGMGNETVPVDDDSSEENSELEEQEAALSSKRKGARAFEQRELVARAFAGDNVVKQFEEAKRREMESDAPKEVDTTLPGWGSWGGRGTKKAAPKPNLIKKVAGIDPKSRADYGKAHVIISEKRDKKAAKYAIKDLPYPYTSKAQYEARMDTPLGSEWNTRLGFQRGTLPKVVKKMGTVVDPLEKLL